MKYDEAKIFLNKLEDMVTFLIPHYISAVSDTHLDVYKRQVKAVTAGMAVAMMSVNRP